MRKCHNRDCPDCYPDGEPGPGPAWSWPYSVALLIALAVFAVWFVTSGAFQPELTP